MKALKITLFCLLAIGVHFGIVGLKAAPIVPKNIVLVGPPASGKGTQAAFLSQKLQVPTISTGDLLRQEVAKGTPNGQAIADAMEKGELVDSRVIATLLKARLAEADCKNGFILDGFPRSLEQAEMLDSMGIEINLVIEINVPDNDVKKRITGRRIHMASGRSYHTEYNPPKVEGKDDVTGEPLIQRSDDTLETVNKRLDTYHTQTQPVIDFYLTKQSQGGLTYIELNGSLDIRVIQGILAKELKLPK